MCDAPQKWERQPIFGCEMESWSAVRVPLNNESVLTFPMRCSHERVAHRGVDIGDSRSHTGSLGLVLGGHAIAVIPLFSLDLSRPFGGVDWFPAIALGELAFKLILIICLPDSELPSCSVVCLGTRLAGKNERLFANKVITLVENLDGRHANDHDPVLGPGLVGRNSTIAIRQQRVKVVVGGVGGSAGSSGCGFALGSGSGLGSLGVAYLVVVPGGLDVPYHLL